MRAMVVEEFSFFVVQGARPLSNGELDHEDEFYWAQSVSLRAFEKTHSTRSHERSIYIKETTRLLHERGSNIQNIVSLLDLIYVFS